MTHSTKKSCLGLASDRTFVSSGKFEEMNEERGEETVHEADGAALLGRDRGQSATPARLTLDGRVLANSTPVFISLKREEQSRSRQVEGRFDYSAGQDCARSAIRG